ncbi:hypothetical protein [Streptomyces sp. NPDC048473]|uniref:hypothetical protein n=1 Tax=unclassified Streptomyces TaxID=2593676 RepID=UPI0037133C5B
MQILKGHPGPVCDPRSRLIPGGKVLLNCQMITQQHARYVSITHENDDPDWWMPTWIPFAEEAEGHDGFLLDTGHPACPVLRYTETYYPRMYAPSLARFISSVSSAPEHGSTTDSTPFAGLHARVENNSLIWDF